jgi:hypothetical protein
MASTTLSAEHLAQLSTEELSSMLADAQFALEPSPTYLRGLAMQERIRRHALECQNLDCGFNPLV